MVGVPARQVGWVSAYGEKIPLDISGNGQWTCIHTGDVYKTNGNKLCREPGPVDILSYIPGIKLDRLVQVGSGSR